ncbi:MAG: MBL fold metallo-hydrolase [Phenylobacterium sp. RIFCSPHIGHO2_01_FULL_69_31]|uniref:MBL fold metallo-hydrolase n=1 Tax=Phenylobacterium sp. RIFCSPHIGHO2_01_FULL_69_31 TaxID=1801944 RepID=UPI0008C045F1|nr:MBL fold metallo-hydrolase [Phenylobacterium sp. RIFCSPHIGHO2_01_FULL_69_31]OHB27583.1 MAG: MBL fold metallo-hydrolase [Phenylobacterium sp. RIFCSPHIGHO2_01_FULL_69_31]
MPFDLTFHGAAGCVTGFCARLTTDRANVLIDCGMFQGSKTLKALNYERFPFDAEEVDAVLLTHPHIDHSGLLPKLLRAGFKGPILATAGTRDLCAVMLPDAGDIQESEVRQLNRRNQQRGRDLVEPIYTVRDAKRTLELFKTVKLGREVDVAPGITATFWEAGHILGSASIEVRVETEEGPVTLLFSGDLGPGGRDFLPDPEGPTGVDYLVIESTYGSRVRPTLDPASRRRLLANELRDAQKAGGPLLIPAFAVERSQELLADLQILTRDGEIPEADIFLDSPLAIEATEVFRERGWSPVMERNPFEDLRHSGRLMFLKEPWESDRLERLRGWHIILAASGMCDAGRVRKHLKRLLWRRDATVLLPGYQASGTLGRYLAEGASSVRIQGEDISVRARIRSLDIYSGHADQGGLVAWAKARQPVSGMVFLAHGEPDGLEGLRGALAEAGFAPDKLAIPALDERFRLTKAGATAVAGKARILPAAAARPDWHNARARLLLDLNARLDALPDDAAREAMLAALARSVAAGAPVDVGQGGAPAPAAV